jgi:hypothetical protein
MIRPYAEGSLRRPALERVQYVRQLRIDREERVVPSSATEDSWSFRDRDDHGPREPRTRATSGAVDGNALICFTDGIDEDAQQDVLNSMLLAQLEANSKYSKDDQFEAWFIHYKAVLNQIGWDAPRANWARRRGSPSRFTMEQVLRKRLSDAEDPRQANDVGTIVGAYNALPHDDRRVTIFERNAHSDRVGAFQVVYVGETRNNRLYMMLSAYALVSPEPINRILTFNCPGSSTVAESSVPLVLQRRVYARCRAAVEEKLVAFVHDYIATLKV